MSERDIKTGAIIVDSMIAVSVDYDGSMRHFSTFIAHF
jgi:hypothetical protein